MSYGQGRGQPMQRGGMMNGAGMQRAPQMPQGRPGDNLILFEIVFLHRPAIVVNTIRCLLLAKFSGIPPQMIQPMMRHPNMMEQPFNPSAPYQGQRPDQFMPTPPQGFMGRGQPYPGMMPGPHPGAPQGPGGPQLMMIDPSQQANGPHQMGGRPPGAPPQQPVHIFNVFSPVFCL
uniref:Zinc finger protein 207 n=1 Tax=Heterorhabditis bacteriophora TaxID=37862 RepID=A0A1I7X8G9_HETBA